MADPKTSAPKLKNDEIDTALVRSLADILNDTDLTEIEVERGDLKIRVAREVTVAAPVQYAAAPAQMAAALVLNPAGYGHTSVALLDALKTLTIPIVECHLSNPAARERFRHRSYVSPVAAGVVSGFGPFSYELAVKAALRLAQEHRAAADRSV